MVLLAIPMTMLWAVNVGIVLLRLADDKRIGEGDKLPC